MSNTRAWVVLVWFAALSHMREEYYPAAEVGIFDSRVCGRALSQLLIIGLIEGGRGVVA